MALTRSLTTYQDLIDHLVFFSKGNPTPEFRRDARRAIQSARDYIGNVHAWTYWTRESRINFDAPQTDSDGGTIEYDHTGGSSERLVTLTDDTWPDWAAYGTLIIDSVRYEVASRLSSTTLQLSINSNPGADVASGTGYTLMRDTYPLPPDCVSIDQICVVGSWRRVCYVHWRDWLATTRYNVTSSGTPSRYTIMGDPNFLGTLAARFQPYPDSADSADFVYRGRPRPLKIEDYSTGTVTTAEDSTTVTGSGTVFTDDHIGCVIRTSPDTTDYPTGLDGANPFKEERVVMSVESSTSLTVDRVFNNSLSNVKYRIGDPLDMEYGSMLNAFLRCCEYQMGIVRRTQGIPELKALMDDCILMAREADSRNSQPRAVGFGNYGRDLSDMPGGDDVE